MKQQSEIRWSDAWLLTAIYQSSREAAADLVHVIAAADFINHAVPNPESGLVRLREAELIEQQAGEGLRFLCTAEALATIDELADETMSVYDLWKELERRLGAVPWTPGEPLPHPDNTHSYPGFSPAMYREAVEAYLKRMRGR